MEKIITITTDTIHPDDLKKFAREMVDNIDHDDDDDPVDLYDWHGHEKAEYEFAICLWQELAECDEPGVWCSYSDEREELDGETWTEAGLATLLDD